MTENAHPENDRMENAQGGKYQKIHTLENGMKCTKENARAENGRKYAYWKIAENAHHKMTERKMQNMENGRM